MKVFKFNKDGAYFIKMAKPLQDKLLSKNFFTLDELKELDLIKSICISGGGSLFSYGKEKDFEIVEVETQNSKMNLSETIAHLKELIG